MAWGAAVNGELKTYINERPIQLALSGPAAGVLAAREVARQLDYANAIVISGFRIPALTSRRTRAIPATTSTSRSARSGRTRTRPLTAASGHRHEGPHRGGLEARRKGPLHGSHRLGRLVGLIIQQPIQQRREKSSVTSVSTQMSASQVRGRWGPDQ